MEGKRGEKWGRKFEENREISGEENWEKSGEKSREKSGEKKGGGTLYESPCSLNLET